MEDFKEKLRTLEKPIEYVKFQFTDIAGNLREVSATRESIGGYKTTDGSSVFGQIIPPTESAMVLVPDSNTLKILPWSKDTARVLCDVYYYPKEEGVDPVPFEGCTRSILSRIEKNLGNELGDKVKARFGREATKFHAHFAPELEFLLLKDKYDFKNIHRDQNLANNNYFLPLEEKIDETLKTITKYFAITELKREQYHSEVTTYQCEVGVGHGNVLKMADATMTLKYIIKKVAQLNGLRASFIPKFKKGVNGSGMHVHQNLAATIDGKEYNLFFDESKIDGLSDIGRNYFAGALNHAEEITAITNPLPISYKRLVPGCEAPTYIAWDWQNRTALCRGFGQNTKKIRLEYRSPDPTCNPYLAFSAMLSSGLEGIYKNLELPPPQKRDFYHDNEGVKELPGDLGMALNAMVKSEMLRKRMGNFIVDTVYKLGKDSWKSYSQEVSDIDIQRYF